MNERERIRELLGTSLEGEPPAAVDADALVRLGQRRVRLRRLTGAAGVLAVAVVLLVGTALVRPLIADNRTQTAANPPATAAALTTAPDPTGVPDRQFTNNQANELITELLKEDDPGARVVLSSTTFTTKGTTSTLTTTLTDNLGTGALTVTSETMSQPVDPCPSGATNCGTGTRLGQPVAGYTRGTTTIAVTQRGSSVVTTALTIVAPANASSRPPQGALNGRLALLAVQVLNLVHPVSR